MPAPLANRFSHYEVDLNLDDWVAWAYQHQIDERIIGFRFRPEQLFKFDATHNPVAFPTPRSWEFRPMLPYRNLATLRPYYWVRCKPVSVQPLGLNSKTFIDSLEHMPDLDAILRGERSQSSRSRLTIRGRFRLSGSRHSRQGSSEAHVVYGHILDYAKAFPLKKWALCWCRICYVRWVTIFLAYLPLLNGRRQWAILCCMII